MSGGFDFPPASDANHPIGSLTQRLDSLRQTFQTERDERAAAARDRQHVMSTPPPAMPRPRRRFASSTATSTLADAHRPRSPVSSSPAFPLRDTPRITDRLRQVAAGTRAQLRRLRQEMSEENQDIAEELRDRRALLDRMSNHLDGILSHSASSTTSASDELSSRADTETRLRNIDTTDLPRRRSHKRRKLDHDGDMAMPEPYGYCGQVVPGQLKMEIVSCDGGEYSARDQRSMSLENYRAENVLRNDGSVYCTKSSRCNMMLRQRGEALFHLESLVIAAPKRGYTAPIQQGLVFIGMSAETLSSATSSYSIQYSDNTTHASRTRSPTPQARDSERLSLLEAVNDDQIWQASRSRHNASEMPYHPPLPRPSHPRLPRDFPTFSASESILPDGEEDASQATAQGNAFLDNCDWPTTNDPTMASSLTRAPTPPPFTVTTVMESSDEDRENGGREASYGPYGLPPLIPITATTDSETDGENASDASLARRIFRRNSLRHARPLRRSSPGHIAHHLLDEDESPDTLEPNALFFMPENDCRITIRFNPPVAGKFILLKLFSPQLRDGGNIDIEHVAAHGFSGPRFFPSIEPA